MKSFKKMVTVGSLTVAIGAGAVATADAGAYEITPQTCVQLGKGFNPYTLDCKVANGIWEDSKSSATPVAGMVLFEASFVESRSELDRYLKLDINMSAKMSIFKGSLDLDYNSRTRTDDRSFYYVVHAWQDYSPENVGPLELTTRGEELLREKRCLDEQGNGLPGCIRDLPGFFAAAGNEVVTSITKGSRISVVYKFTSSTLDKREELKSHLNSEFGSSFSSSADIHSILAQKDAGASWEYFVLQEGTFLDPGNPMHQNHARTADKSGATILELIGADPSNGPQIRDIIKRAAAVTYSSAVPVRFNTEQTYNYLGLTPEEISEVRNVGLLGRHNRRAMLILDVATDMARYRNTLNSVLDEAPLMAEQRLSLLALRDAADDKSEDLGALIDQLRMVRSVGDLPPRADIRAARPADISGIVSIYGADKLADFSGWAAQFWIQNSHNWKEVVGGGSFRPIVEFPAPALLNRVTLSLNGAPLHTLSDLKGSWPASEQFAAYTIRNRKWLDNSGECYTRNVAMEYHKSHATRAVADSTWQLSWTAVDGSSAAIDLAQITDSTLAIVDDALPNCAS